MHLRSASNVDAHISVPLQCMETRTTTVKTGALQNLNYKAAYECHVVAHPESANEFDVDFEVDSAFKQEPAKRAQRLRQLARGIRQFVKLAYSLPASKPKKRAQEVEGLPTWRFDLTVIVAAVVFGVPLLF